MRLKTRTEIFLRALFRRERQPSVILTGNAGDGRTYLWHRIVEAFTGQPVTDWADRLDWPIARDGLTLRVAKDLSEVSEEKGEEVLWELALDRLEELYREVDRQLREGPDGDHGGLYERYGLVIGPIEAQEAGLLARQRINVEYYDRNRLALLEKMKHAGLAVECSDATAVVRG